MMKEQKVVMVNKFMGQMLTSYWREYGVVTCKLFRYNWEEIRSGTTVGGGDKRINARNSAEILYLIMLCMLIL